MKRERVGKDSLKTGKTPKLNAANRPKVIKTVEKLGSWYWQ